MKEVNFWETTFYKDNYESITKNQLKEEIKDNDYNIIVIDSFVPSENPFIDYNIYSTIERKVKQLQIKLNYTNGDYPIMREKRIDGNVLINSDFLIQNKEDILDIYYELIQRQTRPYITIQKELFDNERFKKLIKTKNNAFYNLKINKNDLFEENLDYLEKNNIDYRINNVFHSNIKINGESINSLSQKDFIYLDAKDIMFSLNQIDYIKDNATIELTDSKDIDINLKAYSHLVALLEKNQKKSTVILNKDLLGEKVNHIDFDNLKLDYVKIKIYDNSELFNKGYYFNREDYLDFLIKNIKNSKLSPFERYMLLYNEIGKAKPKNDEENSFSDILTKLIKKIGLNPIILENKIIISLQDIKYGLDGYYISYTTWDKIENSEVQSNALISIKDIKEDLGDIGYIIKVKNMNEFTSKVNELIDKKTAEKYNNIISSLEFSFKNERGHQKQSRIEQTIEKEAIKDIYKYIMEFFRIVEYPTYLNFLKKYAYLDIVDADIEDYYAFLTDLGQYVAGRSNNSVYKDYMLAAAVCSKIQNSTPEEKQEIKEIIQSIK